MMLDSTPPHLLDQREEGWLPIPFGRINEVSNLLGKRLTIAILKVKDLSPRKKNGQQKLVRGQPL